MFPGIDLNAVGQAIAAGGTVLAAVWGWIIVQKRNAANNRADVAEARTEAIVADANGTVYKLLVDRLQMLENEMREVRLELKTEREHSRLLETRLARLDAWIRAQNLTPPTF